MKLFCAAFNENREPLKKPGFPAAKRVTGSKRAAWLVAAVLTSCLRASPLLAATPASPPVVEYTLEASLDPKTHTIEGQERLVWRNTFGELHPAGRIPFPRGDQGRKGALGRDRALRPALFPGPAPRRNNPLDRISRQAAAGLRADRTYPRLPSRRAVVPQDRRVRARRDEGSGVRRMELPRLPRQLR